MMFVDLNKNKTLAAGAGIEPATSWLTVTRSAIELPGKIKITGLLTGLFEYL